MEIGHVLTTMGELSEEQAKLENELQIIKGSVEALRHSQTTAEAEERRRQENEIIRRLRSLPDEIENRFTAKLSSLDEIFRGLNRRVALLETNSAAVAGRLSKLELGSAAPGSASSPELPSRSPSPNTGALSALNIDDISLQTPKGAQDDTDLEDEENWANAGQDQLALKRRRTGSSQEAPGSSVRGSDDKHSPKRRRTAGESDLGSEDSSDGSDETDHELAATAGPGAATALGAQKAESEVRGTSAGQHSARASTSEKAANAKDPKTQVSAEVATASADAAAAGTSGN
jgi:hypothetical protein